MKTYAVTVRRIVREDVCVTVQAASPEEAERLAELEAQNLPQERWETYDCDYTGHDVEIATGHAGPYPVAEALADLCAPVAQPAPAPVLRQYHVTVTVGTFAESEDEALAIADHQVRDVLARGLGSPQASDAVEITQED